MHIYQESTITIPTDRNLTELLQSSARFPPLPDTHSIAKDDIENRTLAIGDLRDRAGRLAHGLVQKYHPKDQSRWAVILPNSVAYVEGCHTVLWLGGIFCPINHLLTVHDMGHALATTKPDFLIFYSDVVDKVVKAVEIAKGLKPQWPAPPLITALGSHPQYPELCSFLLFTPLPIPHYTDSRQRIASIHLSSGTTGASKGVALTHYNYIANVLQMYQHDPAHFHPSHQVVSYTPFVHIANTTVPLFLGPWTGMVHLIMQKYEMHACLKVVEREKATAMQLAPSMAVAIANTDLAEKYDLSSLRHLTVGGLPLTKSMYEKFLSRGQGRWKTVQLYGMTEAAPYVSWQKVEETVPYGAIGKLLPGIQARLCDEEGRDVEVGEKGEMWIKGPNVTSGYIDNAEATKKAFKEAGWYNTGDLCTIDSQGYMSVVGRTKELIKYNGFQVSPADLESYLNSHPAVGEASVAGTKSKELMTELPTGYVVLKDDIRQKTENEKVRVLRDIQEFVDDKVSGYKKLRGGVWEALELPKNATGKVVRAKLNEFKTGLSSMPKATVAKL
jgi:4-coumarate--CoA ligase